jgi:hypothetical protein
VINRNHSAQTVYCTVLLNAKPQPQSRPGDELWPKGRRREPRRLSIRSFLWADRGENGPLPRVPCITSTSGDQPNSNSTRTNAIEDQLVRIEDQLQSLQQVLRNTNHQAVDSVGAGTAAAYNYPASSSAVSDVGDSSALRLPPLADILPAVERYFEQQNYYLPLFDKNEFLSMTLEWYSPVRRDVPGLDRRLIYAAINVVLAHSHALFQEPPQELDLNVGDPTAEHYQHNVELILQSVLNDTENLLALQVLLGMILLHLGSRHMQPATMRIGSAVQLCNRRKFLPPCQAFGPLYILTVEKSSALELAGNK